MNSNPTGAMCNERACRRLLGHEGSHQDSRGHYFEYFGGRTCECVHLADIVNRLAGIYTKEGVGVWLLSPHRLLGDVVPLDAWTAGKRKEVIALLDQMETGAFV